MIYRELPSRLELRLRHADTEERERILQVYGQLNHNMFDEHVHATTRPCWEVAGISSDIPEAFVHRLLLALATDTDFLVAERFQAWALDLASAAFAMHALAWSDRYGTHGRRVSPELIFWRAFDQLFLSDEPSEVISDGLVAALTLTDATWTNDTLGTLHRAGRWYRQWLSNLGLDASAVSEAVRRCWRVRPIVYYGG